MSAVVRNVVWALAGLALAACNATNPVREHSEQAVRPASDQPVASENQRRARTHVDLGTAYLQTARFGVAMDEAKIAILYDPTYAPAHHLLGMVHMYLEESEAAQKAFEAALKLSPGDPEINNTYGWFLCKNGHEQEGLKHLALSAQNPYYNTPTRPYTNSGLCYLRLKDEAAAMSQFTRALALDPSNALAMYNLADIAFHKGDLARARQLVSQLNQTTPPTAESLWLGLKVEHALGNHDGEESYVAQLKSKFSASPEYQSYLQGRYE